MWWLIKVFFLIGMVFWAISFLLAWRFLKKVKKDKIDTSDAERLRDTTFRKTNVLINVGLFFYIVSGVFFLLNEGNDGSLNKSVSFIISVVLSLILTPLFSSLAARKFRKGEEKAKRMFPILSTLEPGQGIKVELKNGKTLSDVAFVTIFNSKITLAADPQYDEIQATVLYNKSLDVKLKKIRSISVVE